MLEQFIPVEFRFSNEEERMLIRGELDLSDARNIREFDGVIAAEISLMSIEPFKKKRILMDFQSGQSIATNQDARFFGTEAKESFHINSHWFSDLKKRAFEDTGLLNRISQFRSAKDPDKHFDKFDAEELNADYTDGAMAMPAPDSDANIEKDDKGLYLIRFNTPLDGTIRQDLNENSIELASVPDNTSDYVYRAFLNSKQYGFLDRSAAVASIGKYTMEDKVTTSLLTDMATVSENNNTSKIFEIVLSDINYMDEVKNIIVLSNQATIIDAGLNVIRLETNPDSAILASLVESQYITSLSAYEPGVLFADVCRGMVGLNFTTSGSFSGDDEVVAIIDSGIDANHMDLKNRIKAVLTYGSGVADDLVGHGTHVAGIVCGDGTASSGKITGIAPKAQIVSIGVVTRANTLDLPVDLGKVLKIAVDNGASIINLSWGYKLNGEYQHGALSVDNFIFENPHVLVIVASGNEGKDVNGKLAYKTLGVPASSKNVLTVGATTSRRTSPEIKETFGKRIPVNFPQLPFKDERLVSPVDLMALISSTGPTDYDSIKPEVVAPGTFILAAKASGVPMGTTHPEYFDEHYTFKTGTSMAAPVITGIAALLREYLRTVLGYAKPTSSLLKAIIIGSSQRIQTRRLPPSDNTLDLVGFPDFDQGFGLVNLNNLLNERTIKLAYADVLNSDREVLESRAALGGPIKSFREYVFDVADDIHALSVTICWIDLPGKGIQNNLQLSLKTPDGKWELGNMGHIFKKLDDFDGVSALNLKPHDKYNNTEKVSIDRPLVGKYLIRITAQNTIRPQGYSLAVLGNILNFAER